MKNTSEARDADGKPPRRGDAISGDAPLRGSRYDSQLIVISGLMCKRVFATRLSEPNLLLLVKASRRLFATVFSTRFRGLLWQDVLIRRLLVVHLASSLGVLQRSAWVATPPSKRRLIDAQLRAILEAPDPERLAADPIRWFDPIYWKLGACLTRQESAAVRWRLCNLMVAQEAGLTADGLTLRGVAKALVAMNARVPLNQQVSTPVPSFAIESRTVSKRPRGARRLWCGLSAEFGERVVRPEGVASAPIARWAIKAALLHAAGQRTAHARQTRETAQ